MPMKSRDEAVDASLPRLHEPHVLTAEEVGGVHREPRGDEALGVGERKTLRRGRRLRGGRRQHGGQRRCQKTIERKVLIDMSSLITMWLQQLAGGRRKSTPAG